MVAKRQPNWIVAIPVYNALAITRRTVEYLLASGVPPNRIELWDDGSTDARWEDLSRWSRSGGCAYRRHDVNLGYTGNVNRAFRAGSSPYVLLLNSDCLIGMASVESMVQVLERYPAIAAVGPLSNAAGNQSVALASSRRWLDLDNAEVAASTTALEQRLAWKFGRRAFVVPSVNGFCALWRRAAVEEVGLFDEVRFARGYGEEDDLCYRLMAAGWLCAVAPWLFATHMKTQSFGAAESAALKAQAMPALGRLHGPEFVAAVVSHFEAHPLFRRLATETVDA